MRLLPIVALALPCALASGCAGVQQDFQRQFTPGQVVKGSHLHAYQAAAFAHGFMEGHMLRHEAQLERLEDDIEPFFEAVEGAGFVATVSISGKPAGGSQSYEVYDVDLVLAPRDPKARERFVLPGAQGTKTAVYVAALGPAAERTGIPAEILRRGHFALYALATTSGSLNATDDAMKRYAFGLLVLREKLRRGERADYMAPLRPAEESLEDVDLALRVVADHHRASSRLGAEVVGLLALVGQSADPEARAALSEQLAESRAVAAAWRDTHPRPHMDDFGIALQEMKLPTPENMLAVLDKDGYVTAAIKVAKGVTSGDAAGTVEGLGRLAPESSSLRLASDGAAAALRGDLAKTADAVLALAERQEDVAPLAARLRAVEQSVARTRATAAGTVAAARAVPTSAAQIKDRARDTAKNAGKDLVKHATP
jgi:hypothetical protein